VTIELRNHDAGATGSRAISKKWGLGMNDDVIMTLLGCIESDLKRRSSLGTLIPGPLVSELWLEKHRN